MKAPVHFFAGILAACLVCSGCGLVPIPVARSLPGAVRQVKVVEDGSGDPVSGAEVVMYADRFENWSRSFPPSYSTNYAPPGRNSITLALRPESVGCFAPEQRRVWRYVRFWGLGPLGTTIHEDYTLTVSARAGGRGAMTAAYCPKGGFAPQIPPGYAEHMSYPLLTTNGTLMVYLRKKNAEPEH